jgi:hypothetical protein
MFESGLRQDCNEVRPFNFTTGSTFLYDTPTSWDYEMIKTGNKHVAPKADKSKKLRSHCKETDLRL